MSIEALEEAIHIVGGQNALARKLAEFDPRFKHLKQGHIWWWLYRSKKVPPQYVIPIENLTCGRVTRYRLSPDVFNELPSKPQHPLRRKTDKPPRGRRKRCAEAPT